MAGIEQWEAVRFEFCVSQGRTHPVVLGCKRLAKAAAYSKAEPELVKIVGLPEVLERNLIAEVVGNAIAARIGVPTPEPGVVQIPVELVPGIEAALSSEGVHAKLVPGPSAGCKWLGGDLAPLPRDLRLTKVQRSQAELLFCFDLLAQNPDRRPDNPNCGLTKGGLLAYDFGDCFSHLWVPIIGGPGGEPWEVSKHGLAERHLFYETFRGGKIGLGGVRTGMANLTDDWWRRANESLPLGWVAEANRVWDYVKIVRDRLDDFAEEVSRSVL